MDRSNGGAVAVDALHRVVLANGLRLTTDLDHLDPRPVRAWRVVVDDAGRVTVEWPPFHPLFDHASIDLPAGWLPSAVDVGSVRLFVGYDLGLHEQAGLGPAPVTGRVERAAYTGALASGAVRLVAPDVAA
ncbi:hypothetical protein [Amycolatopsis cihanbeyliensis]|uniref:Uncharacterized protein n=1 Tax=Amycolatopsis cihanbeyliensis TaxID=1128664 RepID=A0A542DFC5_AMYCI|nr:hypothetical protein [Amycolatopsis cihanbeyliensis]TQJ01731.1 hypothetical protein FB471_1440 [Amycolatopsis cihanbeyliensis]